MEVDPIAARKVQKADREKLRRDRLNENFFELGSTLGIVESRLISTLLLFMIG